MTYRLKPGNETVEADIRRIAAEEFGRIASILAQADLPVPRQVHEVRKSAKRLRSLLRLIAPVFDGAAAENNVLRDAARSLSEARDSGAILDSLTRLKLPAEAFLAIEAVLKPDFAATTDAKAHTKLLKVFGRDMRSAAKRAGHWRISAEGFDAIRPGLKRSYKRLRGDFADAIETGEEEATHNWRKSAKTHWHQTLLLNRICPDALDAHARMASRLSESLGDWRDCGLLLEALEATPAGLIDKDVLKLARRSALRHQKRLLKKAQRFSGLLTAEKPGALTARWAAYWDTTVS